MNAPRHPPQSIEAEQSVLGGVLLDNRLWFELADKLSEADFYRADHRMIWRGIGQLAGANKPCDFVTLSEHLRNLGRLEEAGGVGYLGSLAADTYSVANVVHYAGIVRERAVLRGMIATAQDIGQMAYNPEGRSTGELVDEAEKKVYALRERGERARQSYAPLGELVTSVEARLEELRKNPHAYRGLMTGFSELDRMTAGLQAGDLVIVAGRPGMGKTSFAMNIAENVAARHIGQIAGTQQAAPASVGVFSMEMSGDQLSMRILSSLGRVDLRKLRTGQLDAGDYDSLVSASAIARQSAIFIDEMGALSPLELRARARRMKAQHNLQLIVVDYIQLMQVPGKNDNRTSEISEISRQLKALAKELAIPVIALSQLNRGVESREDKRPRMSDLRESGSIEQDADLVIFIYRDEVYNEASPDRGVAELIVAKQRNGPTGKVRAAFVRECTRFDNLADSSFEPG